MWNANKLAWGNLIEHNNVQAQPTTSQAWAPIKKSDLIRLKYLHRGVSIYNRVHNLYMLHQAHES